MSAITTTMKTKHNTFTVYRDKRKEWRWRLTASNGRILADSGEGYKRKRDCLAALLSVSRGSVVLFSGFITAGMKHETIEAILAKRLFAKLVVEGHASTAASRSHARRNPKTKSST